MATLSVTVTAEMFAEPSLGQAVKRGYNDRKSWKAIRQREQDGGMNDLDVVYHGVDAAERPRPSDGESDGERGSLSCLECDDRTRRRRRRGARLTELAGAGRVAMNASGSGARSDQAGEERLARRRAGAGSGSPAHGRQRWDARHLLADGQPCHSGTRGAGNPRERALQPRASLGDG